jgi:flavodoxin
MKGIVIYDSWTGNTKKIAEAVASVNRFDIFKVNEAPLDLRQYDILVLGSPDIKASFSKATLEFIDNVLLPKRFALFITFGAPFWGQISSLICFNKIHSLLTKKGSLCKGKFMCPGFHAKFKTYKGRPCEIEINKAKIFARKILGA